MHRLPAILHDLPPRRTSSPRREGFAGQTLIVVPEAVLTGHTRHPLLRGLCVTDAGFFPRAVGHRVERPTGTSTHVVIACLRGRGWVRGPRRVQELGPGGLAWLPADHAHAYGAEVDEPWTIAWVHARGAEVDAWHAWLFGREPGREPSCIQIEATALAAVGLERVHHSLERGYGLTELVTAATALREAWVEIGRRQPGPGRAPGAGERVAAISERLRRDAHRPHRLPELAAQAGLSVSRFSALFRRQTGFAPIDFLLRQRIQLAARSLATTDAPISAIAELQGFSSPYYFSRLFRKIMGTSPRAYRLAHRPA